MVDKPVYAPVPIRAISDKRLAERHLRALAAVAAHDRLGANGIGCYASHARLAEIAGSDYSRLSTTLKELGEWGYLERKPHPLNKTLRVYSVLYNEADGAAMLNPRHVPYSNSLPTAPSKPAEILDSVAPNIFREAVKTSRESRKSDPAEAAPSHDGVRQGAKTERELPVGAYLQRVERELKRTRAAGEIVNPEWAKAWADFISMVLLEVEARSPTAGHAERLEQELAEHFDDE